MRMCVLLSSASSVQGLLLYGISFIIGGDTHEDFIATWSSDEVADWITAEFPPWGAQLAVKMKEEVGLLYWRAASPVCKGTVYNMR